MCVLQLCKQTFDMRYWCLLGYIKITTATANETVEEQPNSARMKYDIFFIITCAIDFYGIITNAYRWKWIFA